MQHKFRIRRDRGAGVDAKAFRFSPAKKTAFLALRTREKNGSGTSTASARRTGGPCSQWGASAAHSSAENDGKDSSFLKNKQKPFVLLSQPFSKADLIPAGLAAKLEKASSPFLKKRTKKLLTPLSRALRKSPRQRRQKFFASSFQKRRPCLLRNGHSPGPLV